MLSRLPDSLAHCLQVHRQKANMKTGFSLQWPLLAQFSQDELWSSHPLCITADKEIIAMLFMPMHWLFKTKVHGNTLTRKCRRVKVSGNRFEQFYFGGSPQLLLKFSIVIGSTRAYLSRNRRAVTWVSNLNIGHLGCLPSVRINRLGRALNNGKGFSKIRKPTERNGAYHLHFDFGWWETGNWKV